MPDGAGNAKQLRDIEPPDRLRAQAHRIFSAQGGYWKSPRPGSQGGLPLMVMRIPTKKIAHSELKTIRSSPGDLSKHCEPDDRHGSRKTFEKTRSSFRFRVCGGAAGQSLLERATASILRTRAARYASSSTAFPALRLPERSRRSTAGWQSRAVLAVEQRHVFCGRSPSGSRVERDQGTPSRYQSAASFSSARRRPTSRTPAQEQAADARDIERLLGILQGGRGLLLIRPEAVRISMRRVRAGWPLGRPDPPR